MLRNKGDSVQPPNFGDYTEAPLFFVVEKPASLKI